MPRPGCDCGTCYDSTFDRRTAEQDLRDYRRHGPANETRLLIDALAAGGAGGLTVLDIGAGVGAVHQELLEAGAARATDVDASRPYVAAARSEAERRQTADRVEYLVGDFVALASTVPPADLVALDRVICCYGDVRALVRLAAERANRRLGIVVPKDRWWTRLAIRLANGWYRLTRDPYRAYVHPRRLIDGIVRSAGLAPIVDRDTRFWQVVVYERRTALGEQETVASAS